MDNWCHRPLARVVRAVDRLLNRSCGAACSGVDWLLGLDLNRLPFGDEDAKSEVTGLITFAVTQGVALGLGVQGRGGLWDSSWSMAGLLLAIYAGFTLLTWWGIIRILRRRKVGATGDLGSASSSPETRLFKEGTIFYGRWGLIASILLSLTIGGLAAAGKLPGQPGDPGEYHGPITFDKQRASRWLKKFDTATTRFEQQESSRAAWLRTIQNGWEKDPELVKREALVMLSQQESFTKAFRSFNLVVRAKSPSDFLIKPVAAVLALDPGVGAFRDVRFLSFLDRPPGHEHDGLELKVETPTPSTLVVILVAVERTNGDKLGVFDPETMLDVKLKSN
jgi:hypothetical protein